MLGFEAAPLGARLEVRALNRKSPPAEPPGIAVAPERVERSLRAAEERGRLEREFEVHGELGQGGMGAVLRARDLRLCRDVAVKVLAPALRIDRTASRRFVVEAQVVAQLEHPNIVPLYALSCDDSGKPGFVMRLIGGESLRDYLDAAARSADVARAEPYDLASRLERFLKACDAIEYAHARGVIHRDLKPENVMLGGHNEVYVVDWGLARVLDIERADSEAFPDLTEAGRTVGTPLYMAPEQARASREDVGPAADQFSLGLMLQEVATLRPPRRGESRGALLKAAGRGERARWSPRFGEPIPRALEAIVARATTKEPSSRYPSVAELARDVRRFVRGDEVYASPDSLSMRAWRRLRRRPALVLGALLASSLVAGAATTIALTRELSARDRSELRSRRVSSLTARVARTVSAVDARAADADLVLEGLATATLEELTRAPVLPDDHLGPAELAKDEAGTTYMDRYHQRVNFGHAVTWLAPEVRGAGRAPAEVAHSGDLERVLLSAAVRAAGGELPLGLSRASQLALVRERSGVAWITLGFESGAMLVYPGNAFWPDDFDARKRPWYTLVAGTRGHKWGPPHVDATSGALIVPLATSLFDGANHFVGVACLHVALDELLARVAIEGAAGFVESSVLDDRGDVVFASSERGRNEGVGVHENRSHDRRPFEVASVRERIGAGDRDGLARDGAHLVVFQRFGALPWTLAATFDAATYDAP